MIFEEEKPEKKIFSVSKQSAQVVLENNVKTLNEEIIHIDILFNSQNKLKFDFPFQIVSNFSKLNYKIFKICTDLGVKKIDYLNILFTYKKYDCVKEIVIKNERDYKNFILILCQKHFKILQNGNITSLSICEIKDEFKQTRDKKYKIKMKCNFLAEVYLEDIKIEKGLTYYLDIYDILNVTSDKIEELRSRNELINEIYIDIQNRNLITNFKNHLLNLKLEIVNSREYQCYYEIIVFNYYLFRKVYCSKV